MNSIITKPLTPTPVLLRNIFSIFIPSAVAMLAGMVPELINLHFIGKLGDPVLVSGIGLGNLYVSTLGMMVLSGLNTSVGTLVSQSYGAKNLKLCGEHLNRGRLAAILASIIITGIMLLSRPLFGVLRLDKTQSDYGSFYIYQLIPFLWVYAQFDILRQFLNVFDKAVVPAIIQMATLIPHFYLCHLFVDVYGMSIKGTTIASNITMFLNLMFVVIYISFDSDLKEVWFMPDMNTFYGLISYLKTGVPATAMLCLEWWAYEIQTFFTLFISVEATGTCVIMINTLYAFYSFTFGLQYSSQVLVGYSIGANDVKEAKHYMKLIFIIGYCLAICTSLSLFLLREQLAAFFTTNTELHQLVVRALIVIAPVEFFSCTQGWLQGIIKGLGKFTPAVAGLLVQFYGIALPVGLILAFQLKLGLHGLLIGMGSGFVVLVVFYMYLVLYRFNWQEIADQVAEMEAKEITTIGQLEASNKSIASPWQDTEEEDALIK